MRLGVCMFGILLLGCMYGVWGELAGVGSLLLSHGFEGWDSDHQTGQQAALPTEPSVSSPAQLGYCPFTRWQSPCQILESVIKRPVLPNLISEVALCHDHWIANRWIDLDQFQIKRQDKGTNEEKQLSLECISEPPSNPQIATGPYLTYANEWLSAPLLLGFSLAFGVTWNFLFQTVHL